MTITGRLESWAWRVTSGPDQVDSGSWRGDPLEAEEFALMAADEKLAKHGTRHSGQIFAFHDKRTREGMIFEVDARGRFFDTRLRFPSQAAANEYVDEVKRRAA